MTNYDIFCNRRVKTFKENVLKQPNVLKNTEQRYTVESVNFVVAPYLWNSWVPQLIFLIFNFFLYFLHFLFSFKYVKTILKCHEM